MSDIARKRTLLMIRRSPYGSSLARASIETALAMAAFDQPCNLLFLGDGVLQLLPDQQTVVLGQRNIGKLLNSLPMYDIEHIYVDAEAAECYAVTLDTLPFEANMLSAGAMQELVASHDHLMGF